VVVHMRVQEHHIAAGEVLRIVELLEELLEAGNHLEGDIAAVEGNLVPEEERFGYSLVVEGADYSLVEEVDRSLVAGEADRKLPVREELDFRTVVVDHTVQLAAHHNLAEVAAEDNLLVEEDIVPAEEHHKELAAHKEVEENDQLEAGHHSNSDWEVDRPS